jgi:hypothetical protein
VTTIKAAAKDDYYAKKHEGQHDDVCTSKPVHPPP